MLLHLIKINYSLFEKKKIHITLESRKELFQKKKLLNNSLKKENLHFLQKCKHLFSKISIVSFHNIKKIILRDTSP